MGTPYPSYDPSRSAYGGGITPISNTPHRDITFTPIHGIDRLSGVMSPMPHIMGGTSPFLGGGMTPGHKTPTYILNTINNAFSPNVAGNSSMRYGDGRMSGYHGFSNSSSPSYSNKVMSASPNYSPTSSHQSSPSYNSPRADSNRHENESIKENQDDDDEQNHDDFWYIYNVNLNILLIIYLLIEIYHLFTSIIIEFKIIW